MLPVRGAAPVVELERVDALLCVLCLYVLARCVGAFLCAAGAFLCTAGAFVCAAGAAGRGGAGSFCALATDIPASSASAAVVAIQAFMANLLFNGLFRAIALSCATSQRGPLGKRKIASGVPCKPNVRCCDALT